jgi:hypothetical protein
MEGVDCVDRSVVEVAAGLLESLTLPLLLIIRTFDSYQSSQITRLLIDSITTDYVMT